MQDRETVPVFILCGGLEEGDILNGVINALPGYMHPGILISVQEFPLNASRNVGARAADVDDPTTSARDVGKSGSKTLGAKSRVFRACVRLATIGFDVDLQRTRRSRKPNEEQNQNLFWHCWFFGCFRQF